MTKVVEDMTLELDYSIRDYNQAILEQVALMEMHEEVESESKNVEARRAARDNNNNRKKRKQ